MRTDRIGWSQWWVYRSFCSASKYMNAAAYIILSFLLSTQIYWYIMKRPSSLLMWRVAIGQVNLTVLSSKRSRGDEWITVLLYCSSLKWRFTSQFLIKLQRFKICVEKLKKNGGFCRQCGHLKANGYTLGVWIQNVLHSSVSWPLCPLVKWSTMVSCLLPLCTDKSWHCLSLSVTQRGIVAPPTVFVHSISTDVLLACFNVYDMAVWDSCNCGHSLRGLTSEKATGPVMECLRCQSLWALVCCMVSQGDWQRWHSHKTKKRVSRGS